MRHKARNGPAHGVGSQEQRLVQPPRAQEPVSEHMPSVSIGAELDLVDCNEIRADFQRHRFGGADPVLGAVGDDAFLARDQRHDRRADLGDDAVINFTRQQAQRQADHARPVRQHAFDRMMGFAGVRRPKDRRHPPGRVHDLKLLPLGFLFQPLDGVRRALKVGMNGKRGPVNLQSTLGLARFLQDHCQTR